MARYVGERNRSYVLPFKIKIYSHITRSIPFSRDFSFGLAYQLFISHFQASDLRERFDANKHVEDPDTIDRMIADGKASYNKWRHPDPYIGFQFNYADCGERRN